MQAKDIPELSILGFLHSLDVWGTWATGYRNSVFNAIPQGTPKKVVRAKLDSLIRRGLIDGCTCGCRGDFELTDKGLAYLREHAPH